MDNVTAKVRAFYESYPYPPGGAVDTDGYHARLLPSYIERPHPPSGRLQVLEAGCGRGLNLMAAAALQPDVIFIGVDINRVAIREAQARSAELGLLNLRFAEADLLDPASLPEVAGGYDLILSYGVIHHLSDPLQGLSHLHERLSSQGVMGIMVDGRFGREPLDRYREALAIVAPDQVFDGDQQRARALAEIAEQSLFKDTCWAGSANINEVEFADRCLHVHEQSYDIDSLNRLLNDAGMQFIRWLEPADWSLEALTRDARLQRTLEVCDEQQRYALVERLLQRPKLTFVAAAKEASRRAPLKQSEVDQCRFRINPQVSVAEKGIDRIHYRLRRREVALEHTWVDQILSLSRLAHSDMSGDEICRILSRESAQYGSIETTLMALESAELIYRPNTPERLEIE